MKTSQRTRIALLVAALASAVVGQFYFARKPDYFWDGVVFYAVAVVLLFAALRRPAPRVSAAPEPFQWRQVLHWRALPIGLGLFLGLLAVLQLGDQQTNYWPIFWIWLAAGAFYLIGFARRPCPSWRAAGAGAPEQQISQASSVPASTETPRPEPAPAQPWWGRWLSVQDGPQLAGAGPALPPAATVASTAPDSAPPQAALAVGMLAAGPQVPPNAAGTPAAAAPVMISSQATESGQGFPWPVWVEWVIVALLFGAALALRVWHIDTIPWTLTGDEGNFGMWARSVLTGQLRNMFVTGHLSMPTMYTFFQAAWLKLVGDNITGLRLPWAILGAVSVLGAYLLVRRLFGAWLAFLTALLLATYHFHIHYSRLGLNNISDPLFISWSLYFLVLGWQAQRRWAWAASGVVCGLAFYSYTGSRLVPILLAAVLLWAALLDKNFLRQHRLDILSLLGGFIVVFGPMGLFAFQHPDDFNARINQIGIIQSGWLDQAVQATGQSKLTLLLDQVRRAFFAFNFFKDRTDFYRPNIPLLDFAASILFIFGFAIALVRTFSERNVRRVASRGVAVTGPLAVSTPADGDNGDPTLRVRYAIFLFWFVLAVLIGGALTESPPSSQRLVASTVPVCFFVALALNEITRVLREVVDWDEDLRKVATLAMVLALAFTSLRYYFVTYQNSWVFGSFNGEVATRIGYYLRDLAGPDAARSPAADLIAPPPAASATTGWKKPLVEYFFGAPRMYADFGSVPFIAKGVQLRDISQPLTAPPDLSNPNVRLVFIFLPERAAELKWVQQAFPDGITEQIHRQDDPRAPLLFIAYRLE
jgi:4-amino-4-deoxy-L-arabinose transferase-like glycosyltransferase